MCSIMFGPDESCNNLPYRSQSSPTTLSTAIIDLITFPQLLNEDVYCFIVTASDDTFIAMVKGTFSTGIQTCYSVDTQFLYNPLKCSLQSNKAQ